MIQADRDHDTVICQFLNSKGIKGTVHSSLILRKRQILFLCFDNAAPVSDRQPQCAVLICRSQICCAIADAYLHRITEIARLRSDGCYKVIYMQGIIQIHILQKPDR